MRKITDDEVYMRKIKGLRWYMIALVTLGTVLGYLTHTMLGSRRLMEELHFDLTPIGYSLPPAWPLFSAGLAST